MFDDEGPTTQSPDVDSLIESLESAISASVTERKAREEYSGYEWGYHGHYEIKERDEAVSAFAEGLNQYIDHRVNKILDERLKKDEKEV